MSAAFVAPIRPKGRDRDDVRQRAPARSKPPPAAGTVGDGEPRTKGVRECQRPSWPPSPSEGARRDDVARQPPARSKCPFAAGTARRPRTGCEGCSGMSAAFVAPESVRRARVGRAWSHRLVEIRGPHVFSGYCTETTSPPLPSTMTDGSQPAISVASTKVAA